MIAQVNLRIMAFLDKIGRKDPLAEQRWWIFLRWVLLGMVILTTFLGNKLTQLRIPAFEVLFICLIVIFLNGLLYYLLVIRKTISSRDSERLQKLAFFQFVIDWIFITLLFHYTGGISSPLFFYFLFHVILSGVLLERRSCFLYVISIALAINALAFLELVGYLPHTHSSSFISPDVQKNPYFVVMLLFFFDTVLLISSYFVASLLNSLRQRIQQLTFLQQELEQVNRQLRLLNQVAKDTSATLKLNPRLNFICQSITELMEVKGVAIRLIDEKTNKLDLATGCGLSKEYLSKGPVNVDKSLAKALQGEPHLVLNAATDPTVQYPEEARKEGIVSMLAVPLKGKNKVIGTLRIYTGERRTFSQSELDFLSALASQGATSIENAKAYDSLERQDKAKSEFIMSMTHELKGPLMAIQGMLDVIARGYVGNITEKQRELIDRINRRIESLIEVSTGLLDIYQWESQRSDTERVPISLKAQINRVVDLFKASAQEKGVTLNMSLPDQDEVLMGTEDEMEKVFNNLITNAIKYSPDGGRIFIALSASENRVILKFKDTGIGISSEDVPKIFDEYFRTAGAKELDPYGKGLGLALAKKVVESLGGTIKVESDMGKGTEFIISFPRKLNSEDS
jgi:signal transduction histidine kinase